MPGDKDDTVPDPLENIKILFGLILVVLYQFFTKVVPLIGIGFLIILGLLYLFFKMFGLV